MSSLSPETTSDSLDSPNLSILSNNSEDQVQAQAQTQPAKSSIRQNTTRRNTPRSSPNKTSSLQKKASPNKKNSPLASKNASVRANRHTKKSYRSQLSRGVTKYANNNNNNKREITWHLVGEFAKDMQGECDNDSCIPPYPDPDNMRDQQGKWNWYLFIQSANYWGVDDEYLPGSVIHHLLALTPKECSILDRDLKRPQLSKFILEINHVSRELHYGTCLKYGLVQFFKYSHEVLNIPWSEMVPIGVVAVGNLPLLIYVHENGCPWNETTCEYAAGYNQLPCLKYAHEQGCPWNARTTEMAAGRGSLSCLQYAYEQGCPCPITVCIAAAASGHVNCLKYAHEHEVPWGEVVTDQAISNDQAECLKYAHKNGCPLSEDPCAQAAEHGSIKCLRYLHENRIPWNINTTIQAIENDQVDCMEYAHLQGCPFPEDPCGEAAAYGSINCLRYLHEHGAPWGDVIANAIENDQEECLRYAHQQGSPLPNDDLCRYAAIHGAIDCLRYLHHNRMPLDVNNTLIDDIIESFADSTSDNAEGLFECLKYAHRHHCRYEKKKILNRIENIINDRKTGTDEDDTEIVNFMTTKLLPYISTRM